MVHALQIHLQHVDMGLDALTLLGALDVSHVPDNVPLFAEPAEGVTHKEEAAHPEVDRGAKRRSLIEPQIGDMAVIEQLDVLLGGTIAAVVGDDGLGLQQIGADVDHLFLSGLEVLQLVGLDVHRADIVLGGGLDHRHLQQIDHIVRQDLCLGHDTHQRQLADLDLIETKLTALKHGGQQFLDLYQ